MRPLLTIGLIIIATSLRAQTTDVQDSVKVDKKKVEKLINKIRKRPEMRNAHFSIKDFDRRKVSFSYPDKFSSKRGFEINVLYQGQIILMYDVKPDTYELGEIVDLR